MAKAKGNSDGSSDTERGRQDPMQLIANALGLLLCKGHNQSVSIVTLFHAGFTRGQIAELTGATRDTVKAAIYDAAQDKKKNAKKPKRKNRGED